MGPELFATRRGSDAMFAQESTDVGEDEIVLVRRMCSGDATAFETLVSRHHTAMVRLARTFVSTDASAEEVAQETWLGALRGIERFEGRAAVKTWLFRILVNTAKARGIRDARTSPFSSLGKEDDHSLHPDHRLSADGEWTALWASRSDSRHLNPEAAAVSREAGEHIAQALRKLPESQRVVVELRDVQGFSATEACELLDLTEANQRVLLHRGRSKLRQLLQDVYFETSYLGV